MNKLTNEELCKLYQQGDKDALTKLYKNNYSLIVYLAKQYVGRLGNHLHLDDLIQIATLQFINATNKFDCLQTSCKFSSYVATNIEWGIKRAITEQGFIIRLPAHLYQQIYAAISINLKQQNNGIPFEQRLQIIADNLNVSTERALELLKIKETILYMPSLDAPALSEDNEEKDALMEWAQKSNKITLEDEVINNFLIKDLNDMINKLTKKEKQVIQMYYYDEMTLDGIGKFMGVTRERIRQIKARALQKLKLMARKNDLYSYLQS